MGIGRPNWALILIGLADFIEGATRIQKYAFLGAQTVKGLTDRGFYHDWMPSKYWPFSPALASDLDALVKTGMVGKYAIKNEYGYAVDRFALTPAGRNTFQSILKDATPYSDKLQQIITQYNGKPLMDILHDVYYQFPEYAVASVIRPKVAKRDYESDSYLNPNYDEPEE